MRISYKLTFSILLSLSLFTSSQSQVIEAEPVFPLITDSVDIIFHADQCDCPLGDYSGDIYAHTGLITSESTGPGDWKHVIAGWNENLEKAKLEKLGANTYVLHLTPSLYEYYNIADTLEVEQIAFVFRNENGTAQTNDLFLDVYSSGVNIRLIQPDGDLVVTEGAQVIVSASAGAINTDPIDSISLMVDDTLTYVSYSDTLYYEFNVTGSGGRWIKTIADNGLYTAADSAYIFIRNEIPMAELPETYRDGVNFLSDSSTAFVLYAPFKNNVFLLGDFNDWEISNDYLMNRTPDSVRYWITVDSLSKDTEYAFQYLIDGNIRVADPYTEKILDPANDPYIPTETYPDLKPYPVGKTSGIAAVMQTNPPVYNWESNDFTPPAKEDLIIYELHVQNYTVPGNFKALTDTLDYLESLGINAIELMPVNEFEGNLGWGYNPSFYFAVEKMYGSGNDLKALIDACHARNIAVIIDMVLNHSYDQSPMVQMYWNTAAGKPAVDNPWYNQNSNFVDNTSAHWGNDFNHESQATRDFIDSVNSFWMSEYRVDGFRFDFTKGFSNTQWMGSDNWASSYDADRIAILKRMADEIWERNEDAYIIFEHLADNSEESELAGYGIMLWGNMNHNYNEATMGYTEDGKTSLFWGVYTTRGWSEPHLISYMESHDEERLMYKNQRWGNENTSYSTRELPIALQRAETAAAFFFTIPGPKMIWQWGELGYDYSINRCVDGSVDDDGGCRLSPKPVGWPYYEEPLRYRLLKVYEALLDFKALDICRTNDFELELADGLKKIQLNSSEINATIVGNFNMESGIIVPDFQHTGTWYDYMTGESIEVTDVSSGLTLTPGEYHIFTDAALETPDLPVGIRNPEGGAEGRQSLLFPNPARDQISLRIADEGPAVFRIYSMAGSLVQATTLTIQKDQSVNITIDAGIGKGIYMYQLTTQSGTLQGKLMIE